MIFQVKTIIFGHYLEFWTCVWGPETLRGRSSLRERLPRERLSGGEHPWRRNLLWGRNSFGVESPWKETSREESSPGGWSSLGKSLLGVRDSLGKGFPWGKPPWGKPASSWIIGVNSKGLLGLLTNFSCISEALCHSLVTFFFRNSTGTKNWSNPSGRKTRKAFDFPGTFRIFLTFLSLTWFKSNW